jgi:hypothetical protein
MNQRLPTKLPKLFKRPYLNFELFYQNFYRYRGYNIVSDMAYIMLCISYFIDFVVMWYLIEETEDFVGCGLIEAKTWYFREGLGKPTKYLSFMVAISQTDIRKDISWIQFSIATGKPSWLVYGHCVVNISKLGCAIWNLNHNWTESLNKPGNHGFTQNLVRRRLN